MAQLIRQYRHYYILLFALGVLALSVLIVVKTHRAENENFHSESNKTHNPDNTASISQFITIPQSLKAMRERKLAEDAKR